MEGAAAILVALGPARRNRGHVAGDLKAASVPLGLPGQRDDELALASLIREIGDGAFGASIEAEALDGLEGLNFVGECGVSVLAEKTRPERTATETMVLIVMAGLLVI